MGITTGSPGVPGNLTLLDVQRMYDKALAEFSLTAHVHPDTAIPTNIVEHFELLRVTLVKRDYMPPNTVALVGPRQIAVLNLNTMEVSVWDDPAAKWLKEHPL